MRMSNAASQKGRQKVHTLEKTSVLNQSISIISLWAVMLLCYLYLYLVSPGVQLHLPGLLQAAQHLHLQHQFQSWALAIIIHAPLLCA